MITEFSVTIENSGPISTVQVRGEIDIYTCADLRKTFTDIIDNGTTSFILDLEHIQYIDSTGLGTIAHTAQKIQDKQGTIYIICTKPQVKKIFEVSGLPKKNIQLFDSKESAIETIGDPA